MTLNCSMLLINSYSPLRERKEYHMAGYDKLSQEELEVLQTVIGDNTDEVADGLETAEFVSLEDLDTSWLDIDIDLLDILF